MLIYRYDFQWKLVRWWRKGRVQGKEMVEWELGHSLNPWAWLSLSILGLLIATAAQFFLSTVAQVSLSALVFLCNLSLSLSLFPQLDHRRSRSLEIWDVSRPFQHRHQSFPYWGRRGGGLSLQGNVKGCMSGEPTGFSPCWCEAKVCVGVCVSVCVCARELARTCARVCVCVCVDVSLPCQI